MATIIDSYVNNILNMDPVEKRRFTNHVRIGITQFLNSVKLDASRNSSKGYCATFSIKDSMITSLIDNSNLDLTSKDISQIISTVWGIPIQARMYNDPYYLVAIFLSLVFARMGEDKLAEECLLVILFKLWNGRHKEVFKTYCDEAVMRYAIASMSKQYNIRKYTPYDLQAKHFAPSIYKKYKPDLLSNSARTKQVFEASYSRLRQTFRSGKIIDLTNKDTSIKYGSGMQPLYYNTMNARNKIQAQSSEEGALDDLKADSTSIMSKVDGITEFIVDNMNPIYPRTFIDFITKQTHVRAEVFSKIIRTIHHGSNTNDISIILDNMFLKMKDLKESNICNDHFYETIRVNVISSKNNQKIAKIRDSTNNILERSLNRIYGDSGKTYTSFRSLYVNKQFEMRRAIIYIIAYNIKMYVCNNR